MKLLSEHEDVLAEFNSGQVAVPQDSGDGDGGWIEVSTEELGVGGRCDGGAMETPPHGRGRQEGPRGVEGPRTEKSSGAS